MPSRRRQLRGATTPILPRDRRVLAATVAVVSALLVAFLGFEAAGRTTGNRLDDRLGLALYDVLGTHRAFAAAVAHIADLVPLVVVTAVAIAIALWIGRFDLAALLLLAPGISLMVTELALKPLVDERLGGGLAFPSGHAAACFAIAFVIALGSLTLGRPMCPVPAWSAAAAAVLLAGFVAMCIVVSGDHYPTDVIAGCGIALTTTLSLSLALDARCHPPN